MIVPDTYAALSS